MEIKMKDLTTEFWIKDEVNIMALIPCNEEKEVIELQLGTTLNQFKRFKDPIKYGYGKETREKSMNTNAKLKPDCFFLGETMFSVEFLDKAKATAKAFYLSDKEIKLYKCLDFNGIFQEDMPCLIKIGNMLFILAPRVEDD